MTDLEATRLCAEAMGLDGIRVIEYLHPANTWSITYWTGSPGTFEQHEFRPLHDDAQCMALVKRFTLSIDAEIADGNGYGVGNSAPGVYYEHPDLNTAVVYCVAKMQAAKK